MWVTVYAVVRVSFDYERFEDFVGIYGNYDDVLEECKGEYLIESEEPLGLAESDGIPCHTWVIPKLINVGAE